MRIVAIALLFSYTTCFAGEADVLSAEVEHSGGNYYHIKATVKHNDENWDHFAASWEVLDQDGNILGVRVLRHPHIREQPFTRELTVEIPDHIENITIRAYDLIHHYGGKEFTLKIKKGNNDEVK